MKKLIETEHISFSYEEETGLPLVLEDVNITIGEGEFVAVLGHNGSGKSTFAKHCNAVLLPRTGTVTVDGMNTKDEDKLFEIRQCAGMVFQNPDNQIVANVVEEDVAFGPENLGGPESGGYVRIPRKRPPPAFRRTEAAGCHCGHYRHAAPVHPAG